MCLNLNFRLPSGGKDDATAEQFFIDVILHRHARKLLACYRLKDLAHFAANLEEYPLVTWLSKEKYVSLKLNFVISAQQQK